MDSNIIENSSDIFNISIDDENKEDMLEEYNFKNEQLKNVYNKIKKIDKKLNKIDSLLPEIEKEKKLNDNKMDELYLEKEGNEIELGMSKGKYMKKIQKAINEIDKEIDDLDTQLYIIERKEENILLNKNINNEEKAKELEKINDFYDKNCKKTKDQKKLINIKSLIPQNIVKPVLPNVVKPVLPNVAKPNQKGGSIKIYKFKYKV